jgi:hypothetical protein
MVLTSVITSAGKNGLLARGFYGLSGDPYRYMALGTGTVAPTESSTTLNSECNNVDYDRVEMTNTAETASKRVKSEATFDESNITSSTTIKEIGITTSGTTGGTFWCVCQIPDTVKDSSKVITFTVLSTMV